MDRRSFLLGIGTLASQLLAGCGSQDAASLLRVQLLKGSIPSNLVKKFSNELGVQVKFAPVEQLQDLFTQLESWSKQPTGNADDKSWLDYFGEWLPFPFNKSKQAPLSELVTLGDYWLALAIEQNLIQPLDETKLEQWKYLPSHWQKLVRRNSLGQLELKGKGKVWAAPYRWGHTVIAYNRNKFKPSEQTQIDWRDLWEEKALRGRISLLNHPREVIGLTLKKLNQSYNTLDLDTVPQLKNDLRTLHQRVKLYSSDTYLQPLILGDTWLAVGWSTDVLPVMQRYKQIAAVIPKSGTALWADLWVRPVSWKRPEVKRSSTSKDEQSKDEQSLGEKWIDFCWKQENAQKISLLTKAISPISEQPELADIPERLPSVPQPQPQQPQSFEGSEFLLPLPKKTMQQYQSLWQALRNP